MRHQLQILVALKAQVAAVEMLAAVLKFVNAAKAVGHVIGNQIIVDAQVAHQALKHHMAHRVVTAGDNDVEQRAEGFKDIALRSVKGFVDAHQHTVDKGLQQHLHQVNLVVKILVKAAARDVGALDDAVDAYFVVVGIRELADDGVGNAAALFLGKIVESCLDHKLYPQTVQYDYLS